MPTPIFSNQYDINNKVFFELFTKWLYYAKHEDDKIILDQLRETLAYDYYAKALTFLNVEDWKNGLE